MIDCLFCKIISGEIPSEKLYEDEHTFVFLDIHPVNRGHTLVIPKKHAENIYTIDAKEFAAVMETVRFIAPRIKAAMGAHGINIFMNNDSAAGQLIFHAHMHVIPRFDGDGHAHWRGEPYHERELEQIGNMIRETVGK